MMRNLRKVCAWFLVMIMAASAVWSDIPAAYAIEGDTGEENLHIMTESNGIVDVDFETDGEDERTTEDTALMTAIETEAESKVREAEETFKVEEEDTKDKPDSGAEQVENTDIERESGSAADTTIEVTEENKIIISYKKLEALYIVTADGDTLMEALPRAVSVFLSEDQEVSLPVTWKVYDTREEGTDIHLVMQCILPDGYQLADGIDTITMDIVGVDFYGIGGMSKPETKGDITEIKGSSGKPSSDSSEKNTIYFGKSGSPRHYYPKYVTYNGTKYHAFCLESAKDAPSSSRTVYALNSPYKADSRNGNILKILYYGYKGPSWSSSGFKSIIKKINASDYLCDWNGGKSGYMNKAAEFFTHVLCARAWGYSRWSEGMSSEEIRIANLLWKHLDELTMPVDPEIKLTNASGGAASFQAKTGPSYGDKSKTVQKTDTIKCIGDSSNSITLNLPSGVVAYLGGKAQTGNVTITGGTQFHLEAPLNTKGSYSQSNIGVLSLK